MKIIQSNFSISIFITKMNLKKKSKTNVNYSKTPSNYNNRVEITYINSKSK